MISKLLSLKRVVLISPEFVFIGFLLLVYFYSPDWFAAAGTIVRNSPRLAFWLLPIPLTLTGITYKAGMKTLRPGSYPINKLLYEWPFYWALEFRVWTSIVICGLCCCAVIAAYVCASLKKETLSVFLLTSSLGVCTTTAFTVLFARMTLLKLITLNTNTEK